MKIVRAIITLLVLLVVVMSFVACKKEKEEEATVVAGAIDVGAQVEDQDQTVEETPETNPEFDENNKSLTVAVDVLNVRSIPDKTGDLVGKALLNEEYEYIEIAADKENQNWYKIQLSGGEIGWVAGWLCALGNEEQPELLSVLNGKLEISPFGIGNTLGEIKKAKPDFETEDFFIGGPYLGYGDMSFLADSNEKVVYVFYFGYEETNGLRRGMSVDEMITVLGEADKMRKPIEEKSEDELYSDDELVCFYNKGNYTFTVVFSKVSNGISSIGIGPK